MNYWASLNCSPCGGGVQGICLVGYHIPTDLEWSRHEHCIESMISPTGTTTLATFQTGTNTRGTNSSAGPGAKMRGFRSMRILVIVCGFICGFSSISSGQPDRPWLTGIIKNYVSKSVFLYKCYRDTLYLVDSAHTNAIGEFRLSAPSSLKITLSGKLQSPSVEGLYKVSLEHNQAFYVLNDGHSIQIQTLYLPSPFYNIATDSLVVIKSEENKRFYEFQYLQQQLNVSTQWLLQMMRLYPLRDPFHPHIEKEYFDRYQAMYQFMRLGIPIKANRPPLEVSTLISEKSLIGIAYPTSMASKVASAFYLSVNPDWKQPDPWRDSIIAVHYFDYFNPSDSFYLHTNILPEKMNIYEALRTNLRDAYGQPINDEGLFFFAAKDFIQETVSNDETYAFCLNYFLRKFNKEHKYFAFLELYDYFLKAQGDDCGWLEEDSFSWARRKAGVLRGVQIGSIAPDFLIPENNLHLHDLRSDYTLLLFWASWCPHCTQTLPEIKNAVDDFSLRFDEESGTRLIPVTVSLDTSRTEWQGQIKQNNLDNWVNFSELQGWNGKISKRYNIYATPTMLLLDKNKKIIAKPHSIQQLVSELGRIP